MQTEQNQTVSAATSNVSKIGKKRGRIMSNYQRKPNSIFYIEETYLSSGEFNYSWYSRYLVIASTVMGAVRKVSNYRLRKDWSDNSEAIYKSKNNLVGCYVLKVSDEDAKDIFNQRLGVKMLDEALKEKFEQTS